MAKDSFKVLNMLNMRYVIVPDQKNQAQTMAIQNPFAFGPCWLVKDIKYVESADDEILSLGKVDLKTTAVINQKYKGDIQQFQYDSTANIKLLSCLPNHLVYKSKSASPQVAVFSEIYYPKGWNAYIDGNKVPYFCANYALRGLSVPAGEHTVEFRFEPQSYYIGEKISMASSVLLILLLVGALSFAAYKKLKA